MNVMNDSHKKKFLADSMLGRLAKWLRVMGFDTHYQAIYKLNTIDRLIRDGRLLLSRNRNITDRYPHSLFIYSDHVRDQLREIRESGHIPEYASEWFIRCMNCNTILQYTSRADAREHIPEHIYYQNITSVRFCPSCGRYFWQGSHRDKMIRQLAEWGFSM
jgi:uncharacterized protein with PIN domain